MAKPQIGTTKVFHGFLQSYPSRRAAALAWGIEPVVLKRLLQGHGITLKTAFQIQQKIGLPLDELFTYRS